MKRKILLLFLVTFVIGVVGGCNKGNGADSGDHQTLKAESVDVEDVDLDGLKAFLSDYETSFGEITEENVSDFLSDLQVAALSERKFGVVSAELGNSGIVFGLSDDTEYTYVPEGFEDILTYDATGAAIYIDSDVPQPSAPGSGDVGSLSVSSGAIDVTEYSDEEDAELESRRVESETRDSVSDLRIDE